MKWINVFLIVTAFKLLSSCASSKEAGSGSDKLYNVGFRVITMQMKEDGVTKNLDVAVWYPTADQPQSFNYGGPTYGYVAYGGAPLTGKGTFPMLAFSHGYGGCGISSAFFTEKLASRGWIVACPDHHDRQSAARSATGRNSDLDRRDFLEGAREIVSTTPAERGIFMYRPDELAVTIEGMIRSQLFGAMVDTTRIAAGGHSFGGFTSTALCGPIPDYRDTRIKALLLFSTGAAAYLMTEEELSQVAVPSMLMMGEKERDQKRGVLTMEELEMTLFENMPAPKYFLEIKGGTHFSFNIRTSDGPGTRLLSGSEKEFEVITRYGIAFLGKYVAGNQGDESVLQQDDPMLTGYVARLPGW
jgi:predicted dienelactone hydrolase